MNKLAELAERVEVKMLAHLNEALDGVFPSDRAESRKVALEWANISLALRAIAASKDLKEEGA